MHLKISIAKGAINRKKRIPMNGRIVTSTSRQITGKDVSITYQFENLEIDVPKATGPNGQELGSAKWNINGKIVISSEVQEKNSPQK